MMWIVVSKLFCISKDDEKYTKLDELLIVSFDLWPPVCALESFKDSIIRSVIQFCEVIFHGYAQLVVIGFA